jgi:flagellar hook-associated protein 1 FlgK
MSSDLFGIGASGARAYQAAMGAISNNIANTETAGYSRRTIQLQESPAGSGSGVWYRSGAMFGGAAIGGVVRSNDDYLDAAARNTGTALADVDQRARWMSDLQTALNDGSLGVGQRMTAMFSSVERLASNPTDTTLRTGLLFSFEQINTAFKQTHADLVTVKEGIGQAANNEVAALNDALKQLAAANEGLRRSPEGSAAHVSLLDSRDQALLEVTKRLNVTVEFGKNDVANIKYGSTMLVENVDATQVFVTQDADGLLHFKAGANQMSAPAIADPAGGALGGLTQSAIVTRDRIDTVNDLAQKYVEDINSWHKNGRTAAGLAGGDMLSFGGDAASLGVLITDPADIAGASAAGVINGNLLAIKDIRGTGSIEDKWLGLISSHGNGVNATLAEQTAASGRDEMAQAARADVSGVNLDREAADLLRLQQAYQACARIIQVAKEVMDSLFSVV